MITFKANYHECIGRIVTANSKSVELSISCTPTVMGKGLHFLYYSPHVDLYWWFVSIALYWQLVCTAGRDSAFS